MDEVAFLSLTMRYAIAALARQAGGTVVVDIIEADAVDELRISIEKFPPGSGHVRARCTFTIAPDAAHLHQPGAIQ